MHTEKKYERKEKKSQKHGGVGNKCEEERKEKGPARLDPTRGG
jgi:hypothetical protein